MLKVVWGDSCAVDQGRDQKGVPEALISSCETSHCCTREIGTLSINMNSASNSYFKTSIPSYLKAIITSSFKSAAHSLGDSITRL